jgi:lysophospholipase L1-like esterase
MKDILKTLFQYGGGNAAEAIPRYIGAYGHSWFTGEGSAPVVLVQDTITADTIHTMENTGGTAGITLGTMATAVDNYVLPEEFEYVVILASVNEILVASSDDSAAWFASLETIVDAVVASGAIPVLCSNTPFKGYVDWTSARQGYADNYDALVLSYATTNDYYYIDFKSVDNMGKVGDTDAMKDEYTDDFLHPNNTGYARLAEILVEAVEDSVLKPVDHSGTVKSVIFDFADNYGNGTFMDGRSAEFYANDDLIVMNAQRATMYATSQFSGTYAKEFLFDTSLSKTGTNANNAWASGNGQTTNQRVIIVFDNAKSIDQIVFNNGHTSGGTTNAGVQNTKIYTSTDAITDTTYGAAIANSTKIFDGVIDQHVAADTADDQNLL